MKLTLCSCVSGLAVFVAIALTAPAEDVSRNESLLPAVTVGANVPLVKVNEFHLLAARYAPAAVASGDFIYVISGLGKGLQQLTSIERFNLRTHVSDHFADLVTPRFQHGAVMVGRKIYVVGGKTLVDPDSPQLADGRNANTAIVTKPLERTDRRTHDRIGDLYQTVSPMEQPGGGRIATNVDSVEIVDLDTGKVTGGTLLPEKRSAFSLIAARGKILVLGGRFWDSGKLGFTNRTLEFDLATKTWTETKPIPKPGETTVVRVDDDHLIVAGGYSNGVVSSDVFALNEKTGRWAQLPSLCKPVSGTAGIFLQKYLFLFGDYTRPDEIMVYDMKSKKSETFTLQYTPARSSAVVSVEDHLFVIGGKPRKEGDPNDLIQEFALVAAR